MDTDETSRVLKEFAASFAGTSYEDLERYEHEGLLKEETGESGRAYQLFLATEMVEMISPEHPDSIWLCRVTASATPIRGAKPSKRSLSGCKDIMPGQSWSGDLEHVGVTESQSMFGCYAMIALAALMLFALVYWTQSCRLSE